MESDIDSRGIESPSWGWRVGGLRRRHHPETSNIIASLSHPILTAGLQGRYCPNNTWGHGAQTPYKVIHEEVVQLGFEPRSAWLSPAPLMSSTASLKVRRGSHLEAKLSPHGRGTRGREHTDDSPQAQHDQSQASDLTVHSAQPAQRGQ